MAGPDGLGGDARSDAEQLGRPVDTDWSDAADRDGPVDIDWPGTRQDRRHPRRWLAVAGLVIVAATFGWDYAFHGPKPVVLGYDIGRLEWLWLACLWVDLVYLGGAAARDPGRAAAFVRELLARRAAGVASVFIAVVFLAGTVLPAFLEQPTPHFAYGNQPPLFVRVQMNQVASCVNRVGEWCYGSLRFPFGTDHAGKDMFVMTVFGARIAVMLATVAVTAIVPVATLAGTVAAYAGGWVDRALTTVAETLRAVPAILVYLVWRAVAETDGSLFMLVVAFGLVNWANVALLVRTRARSELSRNYVRAAESAGAGRLAVVRDHLVPNVSRTAVAATVYQVPLFIVYESTLTFLKIGNVFVLGYTPTKESWGRMIGRSVRHLDPFWWLGAVPVAALVGTVAALYIVAARLEELLHPRENR